jgi:glycerol-3-phosphate dehydrogenase (NAD(P)+)
MNSVAVIGAGAWGTALALLAAQSGAAVVLWARDPANAAALDAGRENPRLPGVRLPGSVRVTADLPAAEFFLVAVPVGHLRSVAARLPAGRLVACCKGLEPETHMLPLEILAEVCPGATLGVLTGPNFAAEIAAGLPAASVIAATDLAVRAAVTAALATPVFRLYGNDDPLGAQLGGAAKNVIAIAAGTVIGAGLGENARAALVTRGVAELTRLVTALGGRPETAAGLSGLGDLVLTCTGPASRNFSLGEALGRGIPLATVLAGRTGVTEGVGTAAALIARCPTLDLPICRAVADLLAGRLTVSAAMQRLLARRLRDE